MAVRFDAFAVGPGVTAVPSAELRKALPLLTAKPEERPKLQGYGIEEDPNHTTARFASKLGIHAYAAGFRRMVASFKLNMTPNTIAFEDEIVPAIVYLAPEHFNFADAIAPEVPEQIAHKQVFDYLLPEAGIQEMRRIGHLTLPGRAGRSIFRHSDCFVAGRSPAK